METYNVRGINSDGIDDVLALVVEFDMGKKNPVHIKATLKPMVNGKHVTWFEVLENHTFSTPLSMTKRGVYMDMVIELSDIKAKLPHSLHFKLPFYREDASHIIVCLQGAVYQEKTNTYRVIRNDMTFIGNQ